MSLHRSFVARGGTGRHRNVLSRAERVAKLIEEERWKDGSIFGLPKVRSIKPKKKAKAAKEAAPAEGAAPAVGGAEAGKPAPEAAKGGAAPAADKGKGKAAPAAADKGKAKAPEKK